MFHKRQLKSVPWPEHLHLRGSSTILKFNICSHAVESKIVINVDFSSSDYSKAVLNPDNGLQKERKQA